MLDYEKRYEGMLIAGIDEAGRGPLAGPVVCACVIMPLEEDMIIEGIDDSKKLSAKKREGLYEKIIQRAKAYSIVEIDEKTIDEINILQATKLGMKKALETLKIKPDIVLIDAVKIDSEIKQDNIIKGDALSYNIAAASILAKVYRDRLMIKLDERFAGYGFAQHKGYGTKLHVEALKKLGATAVHRKSFIKNFVDVV
ncbi:MAG: ribonuclease HII [Clostridia bacterium]|jgi:ribonuclease HII|nr:ribonuclease HII [Clostridia bacterium]